MNKTSTLTSGLSLEQRFQSAIAAAGLTPPQDVIADGKIHRFSSDGQPRDDAGWYVLYQDGIPGGSFGCWRSGLQSNWCAKSDANLTQAERETHRARIETMKAAQGVALAEQHASARDQARQILAQASPAQSHPYLRAKGIEPHGVRCDGDRLVIPMRDSSGEVCSLQTITPDGEKRFMSQGRVKGCYFSIGEPHEVLVVCEGFATGASIHECTGAAVAVAFNAGNLKDVALALRQTFPSIKIIVAADDDHRSEGNPGLTKARAAAQAVCGYLAIPEFGADRPDKATDFNDLHRRDGQGAVKRCIDQAQALAADTEMSGASFLHPWQDCQEIKSDLPAAPGFDAKVLLPPALADFVLDEADRMPCAPDFIAAALVVCLGSVIGARCAIKPKRYDDWIVTPNLYGGIVGDPSSKKSPALGAVTRFLDLLQAKEEEKLQEAKKIYEVEKAAFEAHQSAVKENMKKAAKGKGGPEKMNLAMADLQDLQAPEEPRVRRFKANDATVEKIGDMLVHNTLGMLVYRDELTGLLASWEKEGKEGDKAFYLEGWNGTGSFNIDRIGRGSLHIKNLCLSLFGSIQPDLLQRYLAGMTNSLDNDGRIQRFQVMVYPENVTWEWRDRYPVRGAREAVRDLFQRLAVFDPLQDGAAPSDDFVKLPYFCFDDAAQEVFVTWCTELHKVHIAQEPNPMMQQHLGKFEKLFCALALIFHISEGSIGPVAVTSTLRAAAWCEYLMGHARRVYGLVEMAKVTAVRRVSQRLAQGKLPDGFTLRDLMRKQWSGVNTMLQAESVLAALEESGHVQAAEDLNTLGRPTVRYYINPKLKRTGS